ncbi:alpha/beta fold hydrolase [Aquicoccus sp. SCR17]|nr:alpha/beta fold hydrolase [Carideicomes alvinocaridis]
MTGPRSQFLPVLDHEVHLTEWGTPGAPPLIMWHGLARTGRDFDELAAALSDRWHVICPDTVGRGMSSWARSEEEYRLPHLHDVALGLLDAMGLERVDWLGTSMGGLIGMKLAAGPGAPRLRSLVINDIGPEIPRAAIDRILGYAADLPVFDTVAEAHAWLGAVYEPFGPSPESYRARTTETSLRRRDDGRWTLHYDPRIVAMLQEPEDVRLWDDFARIATPCHVLRGASSDILPAAISARMAEEGPRPDETLFADCGHAPSLSRPEDARLVREIFERLIG